MHMSVQYCIVEMIPLTDDKVSIYSPMQTGHERTRPTCVSYVVALTCTDDGVG